MKVEQDSAPKSSGGSATGGQFGRILVVLAVNLAMVLAAVILASRPGGTLPILDAQNLAVGLLPVSAAMGFLLACRRIDLALPMILVLAVGLRGNSFHVSSDTTVQLLIVCAIGAGVGLVSALVTWFGRIASVLWTGLLAFVLVLLAGDLKPPMSAGGDWPWTAALAASLGLLAVGAALLGATNLINLPSLPPIIRSGSQGLAGLSGAWMIAGAAMALASQSETMRQAIGSGHYPVVGYPIVLASVAMSGAYILRGRWGALAAILLACIAHLCWSYTWSANLGHPMLDRLIPACGPLVAILLYLVIDWAIRRQTGESSPTGMLA